MIRIVQVKRKKLFRNWSTNDK